MNRLGPLKFRPTLREKVWGTRDLSPLLPAQPRRIGEAWCIHDGGRVACGPNEGRTLADLVVEFGARLMGPNWNPASRGAHRRPLYGNLPRDSFPLMAKLLFGAGQLSIQVHPDGGPATAQSGVRGKSELWYVLAARTGARLGLGLRRSVSADRLAPAARDGSLERLLRWVPAMPGQCVLVPGGTVHCITGGVVLCEIQQNSDVTYRLYDHGRPGLDGRPRPLQLGRALQVAKTEFRPEVRSPTRILKRPCLTMALDRCAGFVAELLCWDQPFLYTPDQRRCHALVIVQGVGSVNGIPFEAGDAFLVPAESPRFHIDGSGSRAIRAYVP